MTINVGFALEINGILVLILTVCVCVLFGALYVFFTVTLHIPCLTLDYSGRKQCHAQPETGQHGEEAD